MRDNTAWRSTEATRSNFHYGNGIDSGLLNIVWQTQWKKWSPLIMDFDNLTTGQNWVALSWFFSNYDADFVYSHQETFTVADVHRRSYGIGLCMWGPWVMSMLCRYADIMMISHQGSCYLCAYSRRLCLKVMSMLCRCADIMMISHQGSCYLCAYWRRLCLKVMSMLCRCADIMMISHQGSCYLCAYSRRLCLKALVIFKAVQMMFSCNGEMQMSYTLSELQHWYIILFIWFLYWTYDLAAYEMFTSCGIYDC